MSLRSAASTPWESALVRPRFSVMRPSIGVTRLGRRQVVRPGRHGAGLEHGLALLRPDPAGLDVLGPVARDFVTAGERPQLGPILAATRRLDVGTARVEAACGRRVRRAGQVAREEDRLAPPLYLGVGNRNRRKERNR